MRFRSHGTRRTAHVVAALVFAGVALRTAPALASPGQGTRLAGVEEQGPASRSVTALHHNPAMLGTLPGLQFTSTISAGFDQLLVRRTTIDEAGAPTDELLDPVAVLNPGTSYFIGTSFLLDPIAIGVGLYTLDPRFRPAADSSLRYHLASDPDLGCGGDPGRTCPDMRSGGALTMRTDFTIAAAWNVTDRVHLGLGFHIPRQRIAIARDDDTTLSASGPGTGCELEEAEVENPQCAERLSFRGRIRSRWFGLNPRPSSRLDFAITLGIAIDVGERVTLGARYRTRPLLEGGEVTMHGEALVCLPEGASDLRSDLPTCKRATAVQAEVVEHLPREFALGIALRLGKRRRVNLDTNLYWTDRCPGLGKGCDGRDAQRLSLTGLDRDASILPASRIYRGYQDIFGVELWGRYAIGEALAERPGMTYCDVGPKRTKCVPRFDLLLGGGFSSPAVRPGATTAAESEGWLIATNVGLAFNLQRPGRAGMWHLVPGYGVDVRLPTRVGPGGHKPLFDPQAGRDFQESDGDINGPGAAAVLEGRARPTNAGVYWGAIHTFTLGIRWGEIPYE